MSADSHKKYIFTIYEWQQTEQTKNNGINSVSRMSQQLKHHIKGVSRLSELINSSSIKKFNRV